jgi:hypothetical protein
MKSDIIPPICIWQPVADRKTNGENRKGHISLLLAVNVQEYRLLVGYKGSKSNIPCYAILAGQVRATFASDWRMSRKCYALGTICVM